jgi:hypothetical protein
LPFASISSHLACSGFGPIITIPPALGHLPHKLIKAKTRLRETRKKNLLAGRKELKKGDLALA